MNVDQLRAEMIKQIFQTIKTEVEEKWADRDPMKISATSLVSCGRKWFFRRKGYEERVSDETLLHFITGIKLHEAIQSMTGFSEVEVERNGIVGHVDMVYGEYPVEIKTTKTQRRNFISEQWLDQLTVYCYLMNKRTGFLIVFYLSVPRLVVIPVMVDPKKEEKWILERRDVLLRAVEEDDYRIIPETWGYGNWECRYCSFRKICDGDVNVLAP